MIATDIRPLAHVDASCIPFRKHIYLLTYACLLAGSIGHRLRNATVFCPWPSSQFLSWCIPSPSFLFPSLCQVFRGLPLRLFPGGFHVMAWRVMVFGGFLSVCPIHLHFLFFISFSMGSCLVIFQSVVLDILSVHFRCRILRRHLLMKVCILFSVFCVLRHVSDP